MMKPILILPPGHVSKKDIELLRTNGICVVVAKHPDAVKFIDPLPAISSRNEIETAAIELSRKLLAGQVLQSCHGEISKLFVDLLTKGTRLDRHYPEAQELKKPKP